MVVEKVREILDVFSLVWFTLGNAWVFGSRSCSRTSPGTFYLSLAIIVVTCTCRQSKVRQTCRVMSCRT